VYICGKAGSFVDQVEDAIREDFLKCGVSPALAHFYIGKLKREKRWRVEVS